MSRPAAKIGPGQGSFDILEPSEEGPIISFAPVELSPGIIEGDSTRIVEYLEFYIKAVKEVGRSRSNSIGFGSLPANSRPVREVAYQHETDPEWQAVKDRVVRSRKTHMDKAGHLLVRRAEFRYRQSEYWLQKGALTQDDVSAIRLPEDAYMLEGEWYGAPNVQADPKKNEARKDLYKHYNSYKEASGDM